MNLVATLAGKMMLKAIVLQCALGTGAFWAAPKSDCCSPSFHVTGTRCWAGSSAQQVINPVRVHRAFSFSVSGPLYVGNWDIRAMSRVVIR